MLCILGANEGVLPGTGGMRAFIGFDRDSLENFGLELKEIRKALPGREVRGIHGFRDAIQATDGEVPVADREEGRQAFTRYIG